MFMISDLAKINNFLPIIYLGHDELTAAKLSIICGKLRETQKLEYFVVLNDNLQEKLKFDFVVSKSQYENYKIYFRRACWFNEIPGDDGIAKFLKENNIIFTKKEKSLKSDNKFCYFGKMEDFISDLEIIKKKVNKLCDFTDDIDAAIKNYDVVVGRESLGLMAAAHNNKTIYLINNKKLSNSFQMIFPDTVNIEL